MTGDRQTIDNLFRHMEIQKNIMADPQSAHLVLNGNRVLGMQSVPGLTVTPKELSDGLEARIDLAEGVRIAKPVHLCFGMLPEKGIQRIILTVNIGKNAEISILAHCVFPNAVDVQHIMNGSIHLGEGARYSYVEKHVHSAAGGIRVVPKAVIHAAKNARFYTEFELKKGRVGQIDIDYETHCAAGAVAEMTARISGSGDDIIKIRETAHLNGAKSRGALTTKIAVRDRARAEVYNKMTASAPHARGHVDCKEIVQDQGRASAIPIIEVNDPRAHITHEAAIGSVDNKQLETLLARGLGEDAAVELIIQGLLS